MRILVAHNRYQLAGGEDTVVAEEVRMLRQHGHSVELYMVDNDGITGSREKVLVAIRSVYSKPSYRSISQSLKDFRPDILHVHNFFPNISPSIFYAANNSDVPVVQTLHNYRLLCAGATLFRDGRPCEDCLEENSFLPAIRYACYRGSRSGSAVVGAMTLLHDVVGTWKNRVDRYITLTQFAADKLGSHIIPKQKIRIKPNFVLDQGCGEGQGNFALFVGRLSPEKGLQTIIAADIQGTLPFPVRIVGDGPLRSEVEQACARPGSSLVYVGQKPRAEVMELMKAATVLLIPSLWYEGFPMVMVEALSFGLPIIASRIGGLPEIVQHGESGLLFEAGNPASLLGAMQLFAGDPERVSIMRRSVRSRFEQHYTEQRNYEILTGIYKEIIRGGSGDDVHPTLPR
jgi:glycosyltransferase involved in cell wall biosynthesis